VRFNLKHKFEKLASKDDTRPVLHALYLRIEGEGDSRRGYIEGTDSYKLGRIPVELDDDDTEGFLQLEVLAAARKLKCDAIRCNGAVELAQYGQTVATYPREDRGQFPNTAALIDHEPAQIEGERWKIGLNPAYLVDLAAAMGAETVELEFTATRPAPGPDGGPVDFRPSNLRPITVRPGSLLKDADASPDTVGVLMPVRLRGM
jgi:DNA polymerase III sliding clamp (beta) subunit (PCNA family)